MSALRPQSGTWCVFLRGRTANEGRKRFLQSYPHAYLSAIIFQEFHEHCVLFFRKEKNYIIERLKLIMPYMPNAKVWRLSICVLQDKQPCAVGRLIRRRKW